MALRAAPNVTPLRRRRQDVVPLDFQLAVESTPEPEPDPTPQPTPRPRTEGVAVQEGVTYDLTRLGIASGMQAMMDAIRTRQRGIATQHMIEDEREAVDERMSQHVLGLMKEQFRPDIPDVIFQQTAAFRGSGSPAQVIEEAREAEAVAKLTDFLRWTSRASPEERQSLGTLHAGLIREGLSAKDFRTTLDRYNSGLLGSQDEDRLNQTRSVYQGITGNDLPPPPPQLRPAIAGEAAALTEPEISPVTREVAQLRPGLLGDIRTVPREQLSPELRAVVEEEARKEEELLTRDIDVLGAIPKAIFRAEQEIFTPLTRPIIRRIAEDPLALGGPFTAPLRAALEAAGIDPKPPEPVVDFIATYAPEFLVPSTLVPQIAGARVPLVGARVAGRLPRLTARTLGEGTVAAMQDRAGRAQRGEPPPAAWETALIGVGGGLIGGVAPELIGGIRAWKAANPNRIPSAAEARQIIGEVVETQRGARLVPEPEVAPVTRRPAPTRPPARTLEEAQRRTRAAGIVPEEEALEDLPIRPAPAPSLEEAAAPPARPSRLAEQAEVAARGRAALDVGPNEEITLYRGLASGQDEVFEGAHFTPIREDAEVFAQRAARETGGDPRVIEARIPRQAVEPLNPEESPFLASRGGVRVTDPGQVQVGAPTRLGVEGEERLLRALETGEPAPRAADLPDGDLRFGTEERGVSARTDGLEVSFTGTGARITADIAQVGDRPSVAGLRGLEELITRVRRLNPNAVIEAGPTDERLSSIYQRFGFKPRTDIPPEAGVPDILELRPGEPFGVAARRVGRVSAGDTVVRRSAPEGKQYRIEGSVEGKPGYVWGRPLVDGEPKGRRVQLQRKQVQSAGVEVDPTIPAPPRLPDQDQIIQQIETRTPLDSDKRLAVQAGLSEQAAKVQRGVDTPTTPSGGSVPPEEPPLPKALASRDQPLGPTGGAVTVDTFDDIANAHVTGELAQDALRRVGNWVARQGDSILGRSIQRLTRTAVGRSATATEASPDLAAFVYKNVEANQNWTRAARIGDIDRTMPIKLGRKTGTIIEPRTGKGVNWHTWSEAWLRGEVKDLPDDVQKWMEKHQRVLLDVSDEYEAFTRNLKQKRALDRAVSAANKRGEEVREKTLERIRSIEGDRLGAGRNYMPRFLVDESGRFRVGDIKGPIGARQGPLRKRVFDEVEHSLEYLQREGLEDFAYQGPMDSLDLFVRAMHKTMRDGTFAEWVVDRGIGFKVSPSKFVRQETREAMQGAIDRLKAANRTVSKADKEARKLPTGRLARLPKGRRTSALEAATVERDEARRAYAAMRKAYSTELNDSRSRVLSGFFKDETKMVPGQRLGPAFSQTLFREEDLTVMNNLLRPPNRSLQTIANAVGLPRMIVAGTADAGQLLIQMITLMARRPQSYVKAVVRGIRNMAKPNSINQLISTPEGRRAAAYGADMGGSEFTEYTRTAQGFLRGRPTSAWQKPAAPIGAVAGPIFRTAARGFDGMLIAARVYIFEALARRANYDPVEMYRIGRFVNSLTGATHTKSLGISATQQAIENISLFSSRYNRSILGMLGHAMGKGVTAAEARESLGLMLAGGMFGFYGIAKAAGLSDEEIRDRFKPWAGGDFLSIPVGDMNVGIGSAWRAFIKFGGEVLTKDGWEQSIREWQYGSKEDAFFEAPVVSFLRSRASPFTGTIMDFIDGENFIGQEVSLDLFMDDPSALLDYTTEKFTPFNLRTYLEAKEMGVPTREALLGTAVETVGGRTFPRSPYQQRDDWAQEIYGKNWDELLPSQKRTFIESDDPQITRIKENIQQVEEGRPEGVVSETLRRARDSAEERGQQVLQLQQQVEAGEIDLETFRKEVDSIRAAGRIEGSLADAILDDAGFPEGEPPSEDDPQVLRDLYNYRQIFERHPNADANIREREQMFEEVDQFRISIGSRREQAMDQEMNLPYRQSSLFVDLHDARRLLRDSGYFERQEDAWSIVRRSFPGMDLPETREEYEQQTGLDIGVDQPFQPGRNPVLDAFADVQNLLLRDWKIQHPEALLEAIRWGYKSPARDDIQILQLSGVLNNR